jgi:hypothetical protein
VWLTFRRPPLRRVPLFVASENPRFDSFLSRSGGSRSLARCNELVGLVESRPFSVHPNVSSRAWSCTGGGWPPTLALVASRTNHASIDPDPFGKFDHVPIRASNPRSWCEAVLECIACASRVGRRGLSPFVESLRPTGGVAQSWLAGCGVGSPDLTCACPLCFYLPTLAGRSGRVGTEKRRRGSNHAGRGQDAVRCRR